MTALPVVKENYLHDRSFYPLKTAADAPLFAAVPGVVPVPTLPLPDTVPELAAPLERSMIKPFANP